MSNKNVYKKSGKPDDTFASGYYETNIRLGFADIQEIDEFVLGDLKRYAENLPKRH